MVIRVSVAVSLLLERPAAFGSLSTLTQREQEVKS